MTEAGNNTTFPESKKHTAWIAVYSEACLSQKNPGTSDVYQRILRDFFLWQMLALRMLSEKRRLILRVLVEQAEDFAGRSPFRPRLLGGMPGK